MLISNMHFQFLKRTFHRLLITDLTLYWKYHAPDESKLLYRGCLASFENTNFCIKLSKIQSRKNIDISVLSVFFSGICFLFFQIPQQPSGGNQSSNRARLYHILVPKAHLTQHDEGWGIWEWVVPLLQIKIYCSLWTRTKCQVCR
jgi:hypothetical protein